MAKNASLHIRVDQQTKDEAEVLFKGFGISVTDAVNIFLHKSLMVGGLPFDVRNLSPNVETLAAMEDVRSKRNLSDSFDSVDALMRDLNA